MDLQETKTVAEFVTENIKTIHVFKKYGIDFYCGGGGQFSTPTSKSE